MLQRRKSVRRIPAFGNCRLKYLYASLSNVLADLFELDRIMGPDFPCSNFPIAREAYRRNRSGYSFEPHNVFATCLMRGLEQCVQSLRASRFRFALGTGADQGLTFQ
jgi:hypothetical protein